VPSARHAVCLTTRFEVHQLHCADSHWGESYICPPEVTLSALESRLRPCKSINKDMATAQRLLFRATLQPQPLLPLTSLACHGSLCWTGSSIQQQTMPTPYFKSSNPIRQCSCSSDTSKVSSSGPTPSSSPAMEEGFDMVYEGFFARPHKRLKVTATINQLPKQHSSTGSPVCM